MRNHLLDLGQTPMENVFASPKQSTTRKLDEVHVGVEIVLPKVKRKEIIVG